MKKKIISMKQVVVTMAVLLALGQPAFAQRKQGSGGCPDPYYRGALDRKVIDRANIRILYAWNAENIKDMNTYLDLGQLQIGKTCTKYCSLFAERADSTFAKWDKEHPNAGAYQRFLGMAGRESNTWSEYQWSALFFRGDTLTEWATMPFRIFQHYRYSEPAPKQQWTLSPLPASPKGEESHTGCNQEETDSLPLLEGSSVSSSRAGGGQEEAIILGYRCQKATCHWRGRDFVAWFAADIPIRRGPWKFGGLPGLILKVYDTDRLYTFEAVGIEKGDFPIWQYPKRLYSPSTRKKVWKLQGDLNRDYFKAVGFVNTDTGVLVSKPKPYEQLEKE